MNNKKSFKLGEYLQARRQIFLMSNNSRTCSENEHFIFIKRIPESDDIIVMDATGVQYRASKRGFGK